MNSSSGRSHNYRDSNHHTQDDHNSNNMKRRTNDTVMSKSKRFNDKSGHSSQSSGGSGGVGGSHRDHSNNNSMGYNSHTDHSSYSPHSNKTHNQSVYSSTFIPNTAYGYSSTADQDTSQYQAASANNNASGNSFNYTSPVNTWRNNQFAPMFNPSTPPPLMLGTAIGNSTITSASALSPTPYAGRSTSGMRGRNRMPNKRGGGMGGGNNNQYHRNNQGMSPQQSGHNYSNKRPHQQRHNQLEHQMPIVGQPPLPPPQKSPKLPPLPPGSPFENDGKDDDNDGNGECSIKRKGKRKPMSVRYTKKKDWDRNDALKALELEKEYNSQKVPMLILKFPDPELSKEVVKNYSSQIENVHFQQPSTARYCFVQLKADADIDLVQSELQKVEFGTGHLIVEKKHHQEEKSEVTADEIDPYTLYIGNLPTTVSVATVKEKFPTAQRIDIGFAQRMKFTRYAFVRYCNVEEAMDAFRNTVNLAIEARSLVVRFRRKKGNVGLGEPVKNAKPVKDADADASAAINDDTERDNGDEATTSTSEISSVRSDVPPASSHGTDNTVDSKAHVLEEAQRMMDDYQMQAKRVKTNEESGEECAVNSDEPAIFPNPFIVKICPDTPSLCSGLELKNGPPPKSPTRPPPPPLTTKFTDDAMSIKIKKEPGSPSSPIINIIKEEPCDDEYDDDDIMAEQTLGTKGDGLDEDELECDMGTDADESDDNEQTEYHEKFSEWETRRTLARNLEDKKPCIDDLKIKSPPLDPPESNHPVVVPLPLALDIKKTIEESYGSF